MSMIAESLGMRRVCSCGAPLPEGDRFKDGLCYACWLQQFRASK